MAEPVLDENTGTATWSCDDDTGYTIDSGAELDPDDSGFVLSSLAIKEYDEFEDADFSNWYSSALSQDTNFFRFGSGSAYQTGNNTSQLNFANITMLSVIRDTVTFYDDGSAGINSRYVRLTKDGYQTRHFKLLQEFNMATIVNIIMPWGFAIDAISGAMFIYSPNYYEIELEPKDEN